MHHLFDHLILYLIISKIGRPVGKITGAFSKYLTESTGYPELLLC